MAFIKILFLGKTILLTPSPVTIDGEYEISAKEPLYAITSGASIQMSLSNFTEGINIKEKGIIESRELLQEKIPKGSVKAILYSEEANVYLENIGFALSNDSAMLILSSETGVPVDIGFDKVKIISQIELKSALIYWKNFKR